jgi:type I restriction enzyme S subunit
MTWPQAPVHEVARIEIGGTPARAVAKYWSENGEGHPWVSIADLKEPVVVRTSEQISETGRINSNVKLVPAGTTMMSFKLTLGRVAVAGRDLYTNEAIASFHPTTGALHPDWLKYALPVAVRNVIADTAVKGATLNKKSLKTLTIPFPSRPEQRAIAHVLTTLDNLIADTVSAIAKLEAIRQGLLHDMLTRGLDENGEVRDRDAGSLFKMSDLGRVPIEWDVVPLGRILDGIDAGKSPNLEGTPAKEGEWGVLKVSAVHPSGFRPHENKVVQDLRLVNDAYEVRDGDLLMTRANTPELVGLTCLVHAPPPRRLLCDKTLRLRVSRVASAAFVFYATQLPSTRVQIELSATGSSGSMKNIGQSAIAALLIPRPPLTEQARIASVLQAHDETLSNEIRALGKLEGLRYGLSATLLSGAARLTPELLGLPPEDGDV